MTSLTIRRTSERDIKIRGIELILDDRVIGDLTFGKEVTVEIAPGPHRLTATNKLKSHTVEFSACDGEPVLFEVVGIALGGLWLLMTMLGTVAYRVSLERAK